MAAQDGVLRQEGLLRAGSWQVQGEAMLLKTASDIVLQMAIHQGPKQHRLAMEGGGQGGKTNSVDSSSTAAGQQPTDLLLDSATAGLLPPLRQISLDVITATELNRSKGLAASGERQNSIFQDVFEQLAGKDDLPPLQAGQLYTLPSMQFLESMLNDFDKSGSNSATAMNSLHISGPLDLPGDAFDLPEFSHRGADPQPATSAALRPMPFDQQAAAVAAQSQAYYARGGGSASYTGFVPTGGSAPAALQAQIAPSMHSSSNGSLTLQASMKAHSTYESHMAQAGMVAPAHTHHHHLLLMQQQQAAVVAAAAAAVHRAAPAAMAASQGVRQPAVPQPAQPRATPRRTSQAYADFDYEEAEVSLQTSKSGRVRKVASFTGVKRRLDIANGGGTTASESRGSRGSVGGADVSSGEVGSRGSVGARKAAGGGAKGRKGRRTVCLNCGCHQTPQWRCGPLGSRTLCNACGVRFKKDLPLNCWPIRDGMVLPPGAMLPSGFVVPPGITIHTQPAEIE